MNYSKKPWSKFYSEGTRLNIDYPDWSVPDILAEAVKNGPDQTAIIFHGQELTYRHLSNLVDKAAKAFQTLGVNKGDRVAIMLPNCPQYVISYYGLLKTGATIVQTNPMYMEREIEYQLTDSGATGIILLDALYSRLQNIREKLNLNFIITVSLGTAYPVDRDVWNFEDLVQDAEGQPGTVNINPLEDVAVLQYTGGTTGRSKGAMLTHRNLVANALQTKEWSPGLERGAERFLTVLPLFHVYGMTVCMNFGMLMGAALILLPRFDLEEIIRTIDTYEPTFFPGVPTMFIAINNYPAIAKHKVGSIKYCNSGAAPMPVEAIHNFTKLTGGHLTEGYGLSEASPTTHSTPLGGLFKPGSMGIPFPDTEARIVDIATGEWELQVGEIGELVVKGPQVMKGYWNMPEETALTLRDGWLRTGDIARMDEDGYFYIVDRKKDMIIAGGFNIYPRDIEEVLFEHPKVQEAAVCGVSDPYRGETVKAFLVLKPGETATAEEIIQYCRENMAAYKVPGLVEFRKELPKSAVGKILRRLLAEIG